MLSVLDYCSHYKYVYELILRLKKTRHSCEVAIKMEVVVDESMLQKSYTDSCFL